MIYLDNAATTGRKPAGVIRAVDSALKELSANPGRSGHTASLKAAAAVYSALQQGADPARITMSSDACGSQPKFDANGNCTGITYTTPETLLCELRRLKEIYNVPFETALAFFTENPARVAGFAGRKGVIRAGADADIMVLGGDYRVDRLFARGKLFVDGGAAVVKDYFEN